MNDLLDGSDGVLQLSPDNTKLVITFETQNPSYVNLEYFAVTVRGVDDLAINPAIRPDEIQTVSSVYFVSHDFFQFTSLLQYGKLRCQKQNERWKVKQNGVTGHFLKRQDSMPGSSGG